MYSKMMSSFYVIIEVASYRTLLYDEDNFLRIQNSGQWLPHKYNRLTYDYSKNQVEIFFSINYPEQNKQRNRTHFCYV